MIVFILCIICIVGGIMMMVTPEKMIRKDKLKVGEELEKQKKLMRISGLAICAVGILLILQSVL